MLSKILQTAADNAENMNIEDIDEDEDEIDYYDDDGDMSINIANLQIQGSKSENEHGSLSTEGAGGASTAIRKRRSKGPRLDRILEDDDFIPELKLKNEHLLK
jgi:hypothetical protein